MQKLPDRHDTPDSELTFDVTGAGIAINDQLIPFHDSAITADSPDSGAHWPTATHQRGEGHDTPFSSLPTALIGLGVGSPVHAAALRTSASVASPPRLLAWLPTATQKSPPAQDTAASIPPRA